MTLKEIRKAAINKYKSHKLTSWVLGVTCGLFSSAIVALNFIFPYFSLILVPLLILPFVFACYLCQEAYKEGVDLTLGNFFKYFMLYFRSPFNTSFNTVRSFFKSFLVFFTFSFVGFIISFGIFKNQYGTTFTDLVEMFDAELLDPEVEYDVIVALLDENDGMLLNFSMSFLTPALFASIFVFVFLIGKESVNLFLRVVLPKSNPMFLHRTGRRTVHDNFWNFYGKFIGLNWPFYILFLIGLIGGGCLITFTSFEPFRAITMGAVFGFALTSFFYPFFFCNNAALYEAFEEAYKKSSKDVVDEMLRRIEEVTEINPRIKEKFQSTMTNIGDPLTDEDDNLDEQEETKTIDNDKDDKE